MQKLTVPSSVGPIELTIHFLGGEVSEVYAIHEDMEIAFAYDLEGMFEKLTAMGY